MLEHRGFKLEKTEIFDTGKFEFKSPPWQVAELSCCASGPSISASYQKIASEVVGGKHPAITNFFSRKRKNKSAYKRGNRILFFSF